MNLRIILEFFEDVAISFALVLLLYMLHLYIHKIFFGYLGVEGTLATVAEYATLFTFYGMYTLAIFRFCRRVYGVCNWPTIPAFFLLGLGVLWFGIIPGLTSGVTVVACLFMLFMLIYRMYGRTYLVMTASKAE
jgi:hypothetical protein